MRAVSTPTDGHAAARTCRRKQRDSKKFSKQVMAEKKKEKAQSRKAAVADVSRLRRQRARQGYAGELDVDKELAAMARAPHAPGQRFRPGARPRALPRRTAGRADAGALSVPPGLWRWRRGRSNTRCKPGLSQHDHQEHFSAAPPHSLSSNAPRKARLHTKRIRGAPPPARTTPGCFRSRPAAHRTDAMPWCCQSMSVTGM